jgi:hypothetical protein
MGNDSTSREPNGTTRTIMDTMLDKLWEFQDTGFTIKFMEAGRCMEEFVKVGWTCLEVVDDDKDSVATCVKATTALSHPVLERNRMHLICAPGSSSTHMIDDTSVYPK